MNGLMKIIIPVPVVPSLMMDRFSCGRKIIPSGFQRNTRDLEYIRSMFSQVRQENLIVQTEAFNCRLTETVIPK